MRIRTKAYQNQQARWPADGRHILAQFDEDAVVVYQAYRPAIGHFAARHGYFGGEFSFGRMSWIKPNFLWMMYRSGWGTKPGQEVTLAVWLRRSAFETVLAEAVPSAFVPELYTDWAQWTRAVEQSDVRVQWDPDHDPWGARVARRAIQLGLRGEMLRHFAKDWIVHVEDISDFVAEQRLHVVAGEEARLLTPEEHVYPVGDPAVANRLGISN